MVIIDCGDIKAAQEAIIELADQLQEILDHATKDQYKNSYIEEIGNFYEINEKLKELGYESGGGT